MILIDWTRMGKYYCLAGAVPTQDGCRIIRPLLGRYKNAPVRNVGWSPYLMDGHARWDVFEVVGPEEAAPQPPHLEDLWVRSLRPRHISAPVAQRRQILAATEARPQAAFFGAELLALRTTAFLPAGTGRRSLATLVVARAPLCFSAFQRAAKGETNYFVTIPVPGLDERRLPVKDHHLLLRAEQAASDLRGRIEALQRTVQGMGEQIAIRLGLSRAFQDNPQATPACWLMADGFFSLAYPQP